MKLTKNQQLLLNQLNPNEWYSVWEFETKINMNTVYSLFDKNLIEIKWTNRKPHIKLK